MSYYKKQDDGSISVANEVVHRDWKLDSNTTDETHDGWHWFNTAELAYAWFANQSHEVPKQSSRVVLLRLTDEEYSALLSSSDLIVRRFYDAALAEGTLSENDPDFIAGRSYLDSQGIISADRWVDLLAP